VPFIIKHGQIIGQLLFERLTDPLPAVYGQEIGWHCQRQGLRLSDKIRPKLIIGRTKLLP
jgi:dCTP deaminase